ncbi:hypothetical protein BESB_014010 [Besnoitia besnoiti]|uniref:Uncharacterized protein n=1 Tax=Besnoitia besnoiti TaxID=94643 RepID=A0A2A9M4B7_BESBE|nr:hypothetical protein BESB_014010 [Besnoitia besnoiti]PFH32789.1 hypothetical protein BESB_014010 [Besnoitia besnoiti]
MSLVAMATVADPLARPEGDDASSDKEVPQNEAISERTESAEEAATQAELPPRRDHAQGHSPAFHESEGEMPIDTGRMEATEGATQQGDVSDGSKIVEPEIEGASASTFVSAILNRVRDDTAAMQNIMLREMEDIRRMMNYDSALASRIMQLLPALDLQGTLDAMRAAVTRQIALLQAVVGSGENLPNSII